MSAVRALKRMYLLSNILTVDYDPGASELNHLNRIKLILSTAKQNILTKATDNTHNLDKGVFHEEKS